MKNLLVFFINDRFCSKLYKFLELFLYLALFSLLFSLERILWFLIEVFFSLLMLFLWDFLLFYYLLIWAYGYLLEISFISLFNHVQNLLDCLLKDLRRFCSWGFLWRICLDSMNNSSDTMRQIIFERFVNFYVN